nr:MAG TPA: hypothetical protein [Caudoviricetes sp.]
MKLFEINQKQEEKTGYKRFKLVVAEVYDSSCIVDEAGTQYNDNGITWIDEYVEAAKETLVDSSVTVEFADDTKTDILGHGEIDEYKDGVPIFKNATIIGHFDRAYLSEITENEDGIDITKKVLIGEGTLDYMRYSDCIDLLSEKLSNEETIYGSVELIRTKENEGIVYLYGYKDKGRIPTEFEFSGFSILGGGVMPADCKSTLLELNKKDKEDTMDEKTLGIITDSVKACIAECNNKSAEYESKITELNEVVEAKVTENTELNDKIEKLTKALADMQAERDSYWQQVEVIEKELAELKVEKRLAEMNSAIAEFTDEQKAFAEAEIKAFEADPIKSEINSITSKIYEEIGKAAVSSAKKAENERIAELNSKNTNIDIFFDLDVKHDKDEDESIF